MIKLGKNHLPPSAGFLPFIAWFYWYQTVCTVATRLCMIHMYTSYDPLKVYFQKLYSGAFSFKVQVAAGCPCRSPHGIQVWWERLGRVETGCGSLPPEPWHLGDPRAAAPELLEVAGVSDRPRSVPVKKKRNAGKWGGAFKEMHIPHSNGTHMYIHTCVNICIYICLCVYIKFKANVHT